MDLLSFDPHYAVWVCIPCRYTIVPEAIRAHLRTHHRDDVTPEQAREHVAACLARPARRPELVQRLVIPPLTPPIPYLRLYPDGIACRLCQAPSQPYVCRGAYGIRKHLEQSHQWRSGNTCGRPEQAVAAAYASQYAAVTMAPVCCQTFYRSNFFRYFQVMPQPLSLSLSLSPLYAGAIVAHPMTVREQVELQLAQRLEAQRQAAAASPVLPRQRYASEASLWLELMG